MIWLPLFEVARSGTEWADIIRIRIRIDPDPLHRSFQWRTGRKSLEFWSYYVWTKMCFNNLDTLIFLLNKFTSWNASKMRMNYSYLVSTRPLSLVSGLVAALNAVHIIVVVVLLSCFYELLCPSVRNLSFNSKSTTSDMTSILNKTISCIST